MGLLSFLAVAFIATSVGEISFEEAVLAICGASDLEELEQEQTDHFRHLQEHPVHINLDSRSRLLASGLFSAYQVASLCDYRQRNGDILSVTELSVVDGFSGAPVNAYSLFVDFCSSGPAGTSSINRRSCVDADGRSSLKASGNDRSLSYGARTRVEIGRKMQICASINQTYTEDRTWTASALCFGKGHLEKIVIGNFNLKTGQGLVLWSGAGFSGTGSPDSFIKNATLLSGTHSFSGTSTLLGAGTEWNYSNHLITVASAFHNGRLLPVINVTKLKRTFQTGITAFHNGERFLASVDARACLRNTDIFLELASCPSAIAGTRVNFSYGNSLAAAVRYYSPEYKNPYANGMNSSSCTDERALTAAWKFSNGNFYGFTTADFCIFKSKAYPSQLKLVANCSYTITEKILLKSRISFRYRRNNEPCRTDFKVDLNYDDARFLFSGRFNYLRCISNSFLTYLEQGFRNDFLSIFLCEGAFHIDHWDDRIYAWQRDAPGTFSVPSFYGRGFWGSCFLRFTYKQTKLYLKASTIRYAGKQAESVSKRLPKTELKIQLTTSLGF